MYNYNYIGMVNKLKYIRINKQYLNRIYTLSKNDIIVLLYLANNYLNLDDDGIDLDYILNNEEEIIIFERVEDIFYRRLRQDIYTKFENIKIDKVQFFKSLNELINREILIEKKNKLKFNRKMIASVGLNMFAIEKVDGVYVYEKTINPEKFIKVYLFHYDELVNKIYSLKDRDVKVLMRLLKDLDYGIYDLNLVRTNTVSKQEIGNDLRLGIWSVAKSITELRKTDIILKRKRGKYFINPRYFFIGSEKDRENLIKYIEFEKHTDCSSMTLKELYGTNKFNKEDNKTYEYKDEDIIDEDIVD